MVKESRDRNSKQEPARQKLEHRVRKTAVYRLVCCSILSLQFFSAQVWRPNVLGPTISVINEENTITLRTLRRPIWRRQFQSPSSQVTVVCVKLTKSSQHSTMAQLLQSAFSASPVLGYNTKWIQSAEPTITGKITQHRLYTTKVISMTHELKMLYLIFLYCTQRSQEAYKPIFYQVLDRDDANFFNNP